MKIYEGMTSEKGGRYAAYLNYIAELTIRAGWRPEREALRVPSTKYWAFVGRRRIWTGLDDEQEEEEKIKQWIRKIAGESLSTWKHREPEGKDH
jgi:tRNASer (uridine44-2'-O)-methyltransferase